MKAGIIKFFKKYIIQIIEALFIGIAIGFIIQNYANIKNIWQLPTEFQNFKEDFDSLSKEVKQLNDQMGYIQTRLDNTQNRIDYFSNGKNNIEKFQIDISNINKRIANIEERIKNLEKITLENEKVNDIVCRTIRVYVAYINSDTSKKEAIKAGCDNILASHICTLNSNKEYVIQKLPKNTCAITTYLKALDNILNGKRLIIRLYNDNNQKSDWCIVSRTFKWPLPNQQTQKADEKIPRLLNISEDIVSNLELNKNDGVFPLIAEFLLSNAEIDLIPDVNIYIRDHCTIQL